MIRVRVMDRIRIRITIAIIPGRNERNRICPYIHTTTQRLGLVFVLGFRVRDTMARVNV